MGNRRYRRLVDRRGGVGHPLFCSKTSASFKSPNVNLSWYYSGASSEADVRRAILEAINDAAVDEEFEVNDLIGKIKRMGASTVYVRDGERESGRRAPLAIVVYHTQKRTVEARIVTDFLQTSRLQRFIPDSIRLTRISG